MAHGKASWMAKRPENWKYEFISLLSTDARNCENENADGHGWLEIDSTLTCNFCQEKFETKGYLMKQNKQKHAGNGVLWGIEVLWFREWEMFVFPKMKIHYLLTNQNIDAIHMMKVFMQI